jgi:hypothetical protein
LNVDGLRFTLSCTGWIRFGWSGRVSVFGDLATRPDLRDRRTSDDVNHGRSEASLVEVNVVLDLDVYVGSLSRYYAGNWEDVGRRASREQSARVLGPRAGEPFERTIDPQQIRDTVVNWRTVLSGALMRPRQSPAFLPAFKGWRSLYTRPRDPLLTRSLDWDESDDAPYFADRMKWDGYASLLLLTAYAEHHEFERPRQLPLHWSQDPALHASTAHGHRGTRYRQLVQPELWLPCNFEFTFEAVDPCGQKILIGSSVALLAQLRDLAKRTTGRTATEHRVEQTEDPESPDDFERLARSALAIFLRLTEKSVHQHLPMKLHY